jgi:lauroyl/myristoyl acyltransferase
MVAEGLSVRLFEQYGELWSESGRIGDLDSNRIVLKLEDIDKVIAKKEKDFDVVVMVTHQIYTDLYPKHFFEKKFNMAILYEPLLMGQAFFIDCIEKTIKLVR